MVNHQVIYSGDYGPDPRVWEIHLQRDDGAKTMHLMPREALNWRAAEYGIDPADVDTLMEILLHEPFLPTPEQEQLDPKLKAKAKPRLFDAANTTEARTHHLARVKDSAVKVIVQGSAGLDAIRRGHNPNLELTRKMAQTTDLTRWTMKYGDLPIPVEPHKQVVGLDLSSTGMTGPEAGPSPDSMISGSSGLTIKVKGQ